MDAFGERIENLIKQLGITKTKFAEKLSVSQPYISKIIISGYVPSDRLIESAKNLMQMKNGSELEKEKCSSEKLEVKPLQILW